MTSARKVAANRRNSCKSCGPRTAAGKAIASRNALRHGLSAIVNRQATPSAEIERLAFGDLRPGRAWSLARTSKGHCGQ